MKTIFQQGRLALGAALVLALVMAAADSAIAQKKGKGGCSIPADLTFDSTGDITGEGTYAASVPCDTSQMVVLFDHAVTYGGGANGGTEEGTNLGVAVDGGLASMQPGDPVQPTNLQFKYSQGMLDYAGTSEGTCLRNSAYACDGIVSVSGAPGSRVWTISGTQGVLRDQVCPGKGSKNCITNFTQVNATFEITLTETAP